ncbi:SDR family NAD(P)-dependent oxidoreductase [Marinomonas epiphytica]
MDITRYPSLTGKHAIVTGGASGIGEYVVRALCEQGCKVSFFDLDGQLGQALQDDLRAQDHHANFTQLDITDIQALSLAIQSRLAAWGNVSVLVNNAANDQRHTLQSMTSDNFDQCMAVNLKHHFFAAQQVAPGMSESGGSIINMSSNAYMLGLTGYPGYVTAKAAITGLTKGLARELGAQKIRVNAVLPGWVSTQKQQRLWMTEEAKAELLDQQSLKSLITPQDVADSVLFLASDSSRMITGQNLVVDGGRV